jgi:hypothetical protein
MFLFKFFGNTLGLNTRTAHFANNQSRNCTFCTLSGRDGIDETFEHLFFTCPTTVDWQNKFASKWAPELITEQDKREFWFFGKLPGNEFFNEFIAYTALLFQQKIWQQKLTKKISSFHTLASDFCTDLREIFSESGSVRKACARTNNLLCRICENNPGAVNGGADGGGNGGDNGGQ